MNDTTTFAGRPVRGDIGHYSTNHKEQRPIEELVAALDAVLAFPEVEAVRWREDTPSWNDGDVCEFSVNEPLVKFVGHDKGGDYGDGFFDYEGEYPAGYWKTHEYKSRRGNNHASLLEASSADMMYGPGSVSRPDIQEAHKKFSLMIRSGAFDVKLSEVFGDPAEVTATREGFDVESYEHD